MEDTPWRHISETLGEVERNEIHQMYVLPWECDLTQPTIQPVNSNDYRPANYRRRTRQVHNTRPTLNQSEGGYCISYCHFRTRGSTIVFNVVLLAVLALICTVVALLILVLYQRSHLLITTNITDGEQLDVTTLSESVIRVTPNSSKTSFASQELELNDETTSGPEITEASTATILPTTPYEITQENGCVPIPIVGCRKYLPYNTAFFPNRFGLGRTASEGANLYYQFSSDIGTLCHPDAKRLLCRILFSTCYQPFIAIDPVPLPCRSLCEDVGARCVKDRSFNDTWNRICRTLPESKSDEVCFPSSLTSNHDIPHVCSSSPCRNGGTCFEVNGQMICRCSDRFYGITCQNEFEDPCLGDPCVNGGTCMEQRSPFGFSFYICECTQSYHGARCENVKGTAPVGVTPAAYNPPGSDSIPVNCQDIPAECRSVLAYNRSHGILVGQDTFFSPWPLIETYVACSPSAASVLFCSTVYPTCSQDPQSPYGKPCRGVCERVKNDCEYTFETLNLPYIHCSHLQYRNNSMGLSCLDSH
ncbi:uncharacterized protein LOC100889782 [Strongylocentrotus purpuratus]|uniref:Uncharacterized protein n=1 Tax=Strongylocentrotus purpuratus TaxID=7668 RepID=A0A7M7N610_STRPU|nr:uncharacterized protein LOC100889782 [Strongylocentrotus purpuratus]